MQVLYIQHIADVAVFANYSHSYYYYFNCCYFYARKQQLL